MWKWWRSSQGYCTLCALATIIAFVYMAFSVEPRLSVSPSQRNQNRPVGAAQEDTESNASQNKPSKSLWERTTDDPVALFTLCLVVVTAALATVAGVQAGLFIWQLRLMREGIGDAKIAADAAGVAAGAAQKSAVVGEQALIASNRAWIKADIEMTDQPCTFSINAISVGFRFRLQNVGNAPALLSLLTHSLCRLAGVLLQQKNLEQVKVHSLSKSNGKDATKSGHARLTLQLSLCSRKRGFPTLITLLSVIIG